MERVRLGTEAASIDIVNLGDAFTNPATRCNRRAMTLTCQPMQK
jgi:hypothetical protein